MQPAPCWWSETPGSCGARRAPPGTSRSRWPCWRGWRPPQRPSLSPSAGRPRHWSVATARCAASRVLGLRLSPSGRSWASGRCWERRPPSRRVRAQLAGASIVHLATHGYLHPTRVMSSGLLLAVPEHQVQLGETDDDGVLQAWEIASQLELNAELVVLSACDTGRGESVRAEGLVGLTRALQAAGARSVVATHWAGGRPGLGSAHGVLSRRTPRRSRQGRSAAPGDGGASLSPEDGAPLLLGGLPARRRPGRRGNPRRTARSARARGRASGRGIGAEPSVTVRARAGRWSGTVPSLRRSSASPTPPQRSPVQ